MFWVLDVGKQIPLYTARTICCDFSHYPFDDGYEYDCEQNVTLAQPRLNREPL